MIEITLHENPVAWAAPKLGRGHAYDPKEADKRAIRYLIRQQYTGDIITGYTVIWMDLHFEPPASASKKQRALMLSGHIIPTSRDCTNCQKLYEDCLKKIVIDDDRKVKRITSDKAFAEKGKVVIKIYTLEEYFKHANCN